jgi:hypothetical protein
MVIDLKILTGSCAEIDVDTQAMARASEMTRNQG